MADNLIQKSHKNSDKNKYNNVVHRTTSESLRLNESEKGVSHPTSLQASGHNPRKISSFQITSVTEGSRISTDAGEDSADDLDESHTDDISRITDLENETPSFSEDTFSKDDVFYNASSASLGCAPVIPTSSQYGLAFVGQDVQNPHAGVVPNLNNSDVSDMHVSVTNSSTGSIINIIGNTKPQEGMKEIQEHVRNERFKVVKIESTEPFRRGRWMCMDYLDHTTTQQNTPIIVNNNLDASETNNSLPAPDSGVVMNDVQHEDGTSISEASTKTVMELQPASVNLQAEPGAQIPFPIVSPGQSLTQPITLVQQPIPATQSVSVQSPPIEMPQQISNQNQLQSNQVPQPHAQSMTHITLNPQPSHPPQPQPQPVQQMPQSFPQHQLQQVIAQAQGMPQMQQMPIHQPIPQQMQQMQGQPQMQQIPGQHMPTTQGQIQNMQSMQQQIPNMQSMQQPIQNQPQMQQVPNQQTQMQQLQLQQMQGQTNPQQIQQIKQMSNINQQAHHLQNQGQSMSSQQAPMQHMTNQTQIHPLQNQQIPNHMQQMQMSTQLSNPNSQIPQMQPQIHQMSTQQNTGQQGQVVPGMHPQIPQQNLSNVQQQYSNQQPNAQTIINTGMSSAQQTMVPSQHNVPQYHTQQSQMSQPGQSLTQEVMANITSSQQGATLPANLQSLASQAPGSTLPSNLQGMTSQQTSNAMHAINQQPQSMPQGTIQMMTQQQNMPMSMDNNQANMQIPVSDPIYIQSNVSNVNQQMSMGQHLPQTQNMMPPQVSNPSGQTPSHMTQQSQLPMQYVMPQQQNISNQTSVSNQSGVVQQPNIQNMQNVGAQQGQAAVQAMNQQMPQVSIPNVAQQPTQPIMQNMVQHGQNIPMSMQQTLPVSMQGATVASSVVQSQTNIQGMGLTNYSSQAPVGSMPQNVMPIMSQTNITAPIGMQNQQMDNHVNQQPICTSTAQPSQAIMSGTNSPVVSLPVTSAVSYPSSQVVTTNTVENQNFGSPVSAVVSHSLVNNNLGLPSGDNGANEVSQNDGGDISDGKDDGQNAGSTEDESFTGLAMALGGAGAAPPAGEDSPQSRSASPPPEQPAPAAPPADQPHHASASGTSAVAIDNKIEQAMDLVKSHLMFAVREEVEVLKERIAELMERISQLELENSYLRAHATQETLSQLQTQATPPAAGAAPGGPVGS